MSNGFFWKWHFYRKGKDPLRGKNMMFRLVHDTLLADAVFDNRGCVVAMDAAFTSIVLAKVCLSVLSINNISINKKGTDINK